MALYGGLFIFLSQEGPINFDANRYEFGPVYGLLGYHNFKSPAHARLINQRQSQVSRGICDMCSTHLTLTEGHDSELWKAPGFVC